MMIFYFTDPILRAPVLGSLFMCLAASLMGSLAFLKKRSLLGEAISHAAYPGVVLGSLCAALLGLEPFFCLFWGPLFVLSEGFFFLSGLRKRQK